MLKPHVYAVNDDGFWFVLHEDPRVMQIQYSIDSGPCLRPKRAHSVKV